MEKFTPGYFRLPKTCIDIKELEVNSRKFEFEENGELDLTRTWAPSLETKINLEYSLNEKVFLETIPKVAGDEYFVQLSANCTGTKKQTSAPPQKLSLNGKCSLTFPEYSISDSLEIYLTVYLDFKSQGQKRPSGAAMSRYSILSQKAMSIRLIGEEPQITIYMSDFKESNFEKAFWDIRIDLPANVESWIHLEQNDVISIRINDTLGQEFLKEKNHLTLLLTDIITLNLSKFFDNEDAYELITSDVRAGGWVNFARSNLEAIFRSDAFPRQTWMMNKEQVIRRIQNYAFQSVEKIFNQSTVRDK
jgi:hypothetical protein